MTSGADVARLAQDVITLRCRGIDISLRFRYTLFERLQSDENRVKARLFFFPARDRERVPV
jgi:hypothetical protein